MVGDFDALVPSKPGPVVQAGLYRGPVEKAELWVVHDNLVVASSFENVVELLVEG